ncbi:hypothetical protein COCNU_02G019130 [Cocos nucifera]|uniref:Uncharacterized protein n=1 Tax=Cocos nucifera TaxID=13894 RepID=A0A8K0HUP2_COCNU|nr:hypothetical protein COCNU_01G007530 [Cocos nucifera]KAG1331945.1 hypothetical protein COCNU_02G019130 [Cocos nucifera]
MGSCFSSNTRDFSIRRKPTAKVIALDGGLREYFAPTAVSQVLGSDLPSCFLCCWDGLFFDAYIPALDLGDSLRPGQIYFVLPVAKLEHPLLGSDMAALAIKASTALSSAPDKRRGRKRRIRVGTVVVLEEGEVGDGNGGFQGIERFNEDSARTPQQKTTGIASMSTRMVRPGPGRPFKARLSAIEEVAD